MDHTELQGLLGAYAVDAVDEAERRVIEQHLDGCEDCSAEVGRHLEAAAALAAEPSTPPPEVWEGIRSAIEGRDSGDVVPLRRPSRRALMAVVAGATAAVAVLAGLMVATFADQRRLEDRVDELVAGLDRGDAAMRAVLDPGAEHVLLESPDGSLSADVVYLPDGTGYLVRHDLSPLPEGRTYQLWALVGDEAVSAGVLGRDPAVSPFTVAGPVSGFAISEEVDGGATQPSRTPVVSGRLS